MHVNMSKWDTVKLAPVINQEYVVLNFDPRTAFYCAVTNIWQTGDSKGSYIRNLLCKPSSFKVYVLRDTYVRLLLLSEFAFRIRNHIFANICFLTAHYVSIYDLILFLNFFVFDNLSVFEIMFSPRYPRFAVQTQLNQYVFLDLKKLGTSTKEKL